VDQTATTGVSVSISGSSASDGTSVVVTTTDYGSLSPPGVATVSLGNAAYYDVNVQGISNGTATITITGTSGQTTMDYWDGTQWVPASGVTYTADTITGTIPVSALTGTPIALGSPVFVTPESPIGALMALSACFAAVAAFATFKKKTGKQPSALRRSIA